MFGNTDFKTNDRKVRRFLLRVEHRVQLWQNLSVCGKQSQFDYQSSLFLPLSRLCLAAELRGESVQLASLPLNKLVLLFFRRGVDWTNKLLAPEKGINGLPAPVLA